MNWVFDSKWIQLNWQRTSIIPRYLEVNMIYKEVLNTVREDLCYSPTQIVYGNSTRLPADFFDDEAQEDELTNEQIIFERDV